MKDKRKVEETVLNFAKKNHLLISFFIKKLHPVRSMNL